MNRGDRALLLMRWPTGLAIFLAACATDVWAHDEKVSTSEIRVFAREVVWRVDVGVAGLDKAVKLPVGQMELSEARLQALEPQIAAYLIRGLSLEINGKHIGPVAGGLEPIYEPFLLTGEPYIARVRQIFVFPVTEKDIRALRLGIRFFSEITNEHRAVINLRWGERERQFVRTGPSTLEVSYARLAPGMWSVTADFLPWGIHHIFIGYDHISFLLALLLA